MIKPRRFAWLNEHSLAVAGIVVAIASVFIALISLCLAFYEGQAGRHHSRLSVRPKIDFSVVTNRKEPLLGFFIENQGLGPAIISKFKLYWNGKLLDQTSPYALIHAIEKDGYPTEGARVFQPGPDSLLKLGIEEPIFALPVSSIGADNSAIMEILKRLRVEIRYKSFYEEEFEANGIPFGNSKS